MRSTAPATAPSPREPFPAVLPERLELAEPGVCAGVGDGDQGLVGQSAQRIEDLAGRSPSRSARVASGSARRRAAASLTARGRSSSRRQMSSTTSPACPSARKPGRTARARSVNSSGAAGGSSPPTGTRSSPGNAGRLPAGGDQPEAGHRSHQGFGQRRRLSATTAPLRSRSALSLHRIGRSVHRTEVYSRICG